MPRTPDCGVFFWLFLYKPESISATISESASHESQLKSFDAGP